MNILIFFWVISLLHIGEGTNQIEHWRDVNQLQEVHTKQFNLNSVEHDQAEKKQQSRHE